MGTYYKDSLPILTKLAYKTTPSDDGTIKIFSPRLDKYFYPEQITAEILKKLAQDASTYLQKPLTTTVITVPAYFTDSQRNATKDAGTLATLNIKRIINEPTSASLAYGFDKAATKKVMVYDLGGGTFDVSLLEAGDGVFEVLKTTGNSNLGGDDFDERIIDWLCNNFKEKHSIDLKSDKKATQRLREAAEKAKIDLSTVSSTKINIPFINTDGGVSRHVEETLSRDQFEKICHDLLEECLIPVRTILNEAKMTAKDIDETILVGGSTRIPIIQQLVSKELQCTPNSGLNPDEVVALGAAVQAGVLEGDLSNIVLIDVTPLSLGIETLGGINTKLIPRNTSLPTAKYETFTTAADNQTSVDIRILQGERELASNCKPLGTLKLDGINPAPRGMPQIEVNFEIDVNGILKVKATDKTTGKNCDMEIAEASQLSSEEKERMLKDGEKFAAEDQRKKESISIKLEAEQLIYEITNFILEKSNDLDSTSLDKLKEYQERLQSSLNNNDETGLEEQLSECRNFFNSLRSQ
jgi:chaperone protein DnaK